MHPRLKRFLKKTALPIFLQLRGWYYHGNKVACPCCKGNFSQFLPAGANRRLVQCPTCRSNERDRILWMYLDKHPHFIAPGKKVLHIAPEAIFHKRLSRIKGLDYTTGDKFAQSFENTYPKGTIYIDLTDMQHIAAHTYDVILCSHVLEYIEEDRKAMREILRVLKPNGIALMQVPIKAGLDVTHEDYSITDPAERVLIYGDPGHIRFYGADYQERLMAEGFEPQFIPITTLFSDEEIDKYCLNPNDTLQLCQKPSMVRALLGLNICYYVALAI
ncbi:methyltransferase family protein [Chitinophaga skermanii]|uniref:Methyltransferase family protein n=1 Tax=Chitinophaga skermanii TaxID=331697 RepID=A0A327QT56_9BACT|nr:class I SAM-dependent methyltransferase [Chitinophaga skermanii]RAJ06824.1 methyltransferase family protein [Chitinophaga skermanii]